MAALAAFLCAPPLPCRWKTGILTSRVEWQGRPNGGYDRVTPTRIALIGCGIISEAHLRGIAASGDRCELAAACDTDQSKAETAAATWRELRPEAPLPAVTADYADLLADPRIDAVDLCLPHHLHRRMAIAAAEAGKHVLCEKPLALTPEDCDAMAEAAEKAGKVLMHGENLRTAANAVTAANLVKSGRVGTVVGVQATYAHWQNLELNYGWRTEADKSGGGHLIDGAIHYVDMIRHICGDVSHVHAMTATFRPELGAAVEDTAVLNFRFAAGHLGQMFACHASRGRGGSSILTVFGTEGCLTLDAYHAEAPVLLFAHGGEREAFAVSNSWSQSFALEIAHFLDVIQNGVPLQSTPADARENLKVILAAYESARTGQEIEIAG